MSKIKECFVSRWGDRGYIVEADYSQLEVICLAFLSNDEQLLEDLKSGVDIHSINAAKLIGMSYEHFYKSYKDGNDKAKKMRRAAKEMSFQLQYGAGAKSMAESTGLPVETCKDFISNYYSRYSGVERYHVDLIDEVVKNRTPSTHKTKKGLPAGQSTIVSVTKRRYTFFEEDAPEYMRKDVSFRPTKVKNYPVQGFATGDLVPMMLGELLFVLKKNNELAEYCLLINTVHDSIIFDVHDDVLDSSLGVIKNTLKSTSDYLYKYFNIDFPISLPVEIKYGRSWAEC